MPVRTVPSLLPIATLLASGVILPRALAQSTPPAAAVLADGQGLLARLDAAPAAHETLFSSMGVKQITDLLAAVFTHGLAQTATEEDLAAMHRALDVSSK